MIWNAGVTELRQTKEFLENLIQSSVDAIVAAAQVVTAVQTVVSRNVDARDSAVVSFGTIHGGAQGNIVASHVELTGTVRTLAPAVRERVLRRIRETAEGVAAALGAAAAEKVDVFGAHAFAFSSCCLRCSARSTTSSVSTAVRDRVRWILCSSAMRF